MSIYLDHAATTPIHPNVVDKMLPYMKEHFGNPSSIHTYGRQVRMAIDQARERIASSLQVRPKQVIFTSGGTEADNLALAGVARALRPKGKHIITSRVEHKAVLDTCMELEKAGFEITFLPVDETGTVQLEDVKRAIREDTILISVMFANNEIGTLQPVAEIGKAARENGILFHSDAVQAFGSVPINLMKLPIDLLSVSAHKINGPKGVGALYYSEKIDLYPFLYGGSQERKRRPGTENVIGIIGFAEAVKMAMEEMESHKEKFQSLRRLMIETWQQENITFHVNGHSQEVIPKILNVSFPGTDTESLLMNLDMQGIAAASGSACQAGALEVSHVLRAMGLAEDRQKSSVRFSFGLNNTEEQIREAAQKTTEVVQRLLS